MEGPQPRTPRPRSVQRGVECHRLQAELLAKVYERLVPLVRRQLPDPQAPPDGAPHAREMPPPARAAGA